MTTPAIVEVEIIEVHPTVEVIEQVVQTIEIGSDLASIGAGGNVVEVGYPLVYDPETGELTHDPHDIDDVIGLQTALNDEAAARAAGDSALDARLDAIEGLGSLATDAELASEAASRLAGDNALDSRLDAIEGLGSLATDAELAAAVALLIPLSQKGAANGVATLGADQKLPTSQLPSLAIQEVFPVASQAEMLALTDARRGDVALRSDNSKAYILSSDDPSVLADWIEWLYPGGGVASFNGRVGVVLPASGDYGIAQITGLQAALDLKATIAALDAVEDASIAADTALDGRLDVLEAHNIDSRLDALEAVVPEATDALDLRLDAEESATISHAARLLALESAEPPPPTASVGTYLVAGATVVWLTGFQYRIGAAEYYIDGVLETSAEQNVTLDSADPTNPRIDVLVLDSNGVADSITGTANANPAEPTVDPAVYLKLGVVLVPAAATAAPVTDTTIWKEDTGTDWTATPSAGTITIASTNNPRTDTKSIEGTNVAAGTNIVFVIDSGSINPAALDKLVFYIRNKAAWPNQKAMRVQWQVGDVPVGTAVTIGHNQFGFNRSTVGSYMQIAVPMSNFAVPAGSLVTKLKWEVIGSGANVGFYLDDIIAQAGIVTGGGGAQEFRWRGVWSASTAYIANDVVREGGTPFIALMSNVNASPKANPSAWDRMDVEERGVTFEFGDGSATAPATGMIAGGRMAFSGKITAIYLDTTDGNTATCVVDVKKNGTSIFGAGSTKPTLTAEQEDVNSLAGTIALTFVKGDKFTAVIDSFSGAALGLALTILADEDKA